MTQTVFLSQILHFISSKYDFNLSRILYEFNRSKNYDLFIQYVDFLSFVHMLFLDKHNQPINTLYDEYCVAKKTGEYQHLHNHILRCPTMDYIIQDFEPDYFYPQVLWNYIRDPEILKILNIPAENYSNVYKKLDDLELNTNVSTCDFEDFQLSPIENIAKYIETTDPMLKRFNNIVNMIEDGRYIENDADNYHYCIVLMYNTIKYYKNREYVNTVCRGCKCAYVKNKIIEFHKAIDYVHIY